MAVYRFRISFEDYDEIVRLVEIKASQTFEDLQKTFHAAIGFDLLKPASFYLSDDNWKKGREITSRPLREDEQASVKTLGAARFSDFISDPHQKIYYVYDPEAQWSFHVELVKILMAEEPGASYPRCIKTSGEAPKQYGTTVLGAVPEPEDFDEETAELLEAEELADDTEDGEGPLNLDEGSDELETAESDDLDEESPTEDFS